MFWEKLTFLGVGRCIQCMEHASYMQYICGNMANKLNQHYTSICNKLVNVSQQVKFTFPLYKQATLDIVTQIPMCWKCEQDLNSNLYTCFELLLFLHYPRTTYIFIISHSLDYVQCKVPWVGRLNRDKIDHNKIKLKNYLWFLP